MGNSCWAGSRRVSSSCRVAVERGKTARRQQQHSAGGRLCSTRRNSSMEWTQQQEQQCSRWCCWQWLHHHQHKQLAALVASTQRWRTVNSVVPCTVGCQRQHLHQTMECSPQAQLSSVAISLEQQPEASADCCQPHSNAACGCSNIQAHVQAGSCAGSIRLAQQQWQ